MSDDAGDESALAPGVESRKRDRLRCDGYDGAM